MKHRYRVLRSTDVSLCDEAYSEVIADSMEAMLADGNVIEKIMELKAKDSDLVAKIKQFFDNLLAKIRNIYNGLTPDSAEGKAVLEMKDSIEKIQQLFAEALVDASENFQSAEAQKNTTEYGGDISQSRRLSESDLEAYLKAGNRKNKNKLEALNRGIKIILTTKTEIINFINDAIGHKTDAVTVAYGKVNDRLADAVRQESNGKIVIDDNYLELIPDNLQHAYEQHSKAKETGDIDLSFEDFERIPEYLDTFTELLYAIRYSSGQVRICVSKKLENGRILIIETVSKSRGSIQFKNAIGVSEEKYTQEYLPMYKKGAATPARGNDSSNNSLRDSYDSKNNIHNDSEIVNTESVEAMDLEVDAGTESVAPAVLKSERAKADANYMAAVNRGDMGTAQKMVDETAKSAGFVIKAYHGTDADTFSVFDKGKVGESTGVGILGDGFYFAEKRSVAQQYGKNVYAVYLKQATPYTATNNDSYKLNAVKLETDGYDSVVMATGKGKIYMVLDPEQIKSADPVTYDNAGNIIPLSERFHAEKDDIRYSDRGYGGIREALAKKGLDELSKKLGNNFPLSASFDSTIRADNTPLVIATVKANQVKSKSKESPFKTGKRAFRVAYGTHTSVHIKQMGIDAELFSNVASESIAKARGLANEQSTMDVIPHIRDILSNSVLMGIERIVHTDGKGTALYGYRLYNLYLYDDGKVKTPHCLACTVVQDLDKAEGYVFQNIENVTIDQGLPGNKSSMPSSVNGNAYTIAQLYSAVKKIGRFDGGLKYTMAERDKYLFNYTERNDGTKYQDRAEESVSNRSLLANALENTVKNDMKKQKLREYREQIEHLDAEEQKLRELNGQIKELSFAKGKRDAKKLQTLE